MLSAEQNAKIDAEVAQVVAVVSARIDQRFGELSAKIDQRSAELLAALERCLGEQTRWLFVVCATLLAASIALFFHR